MQNADTTISMPAVDHIGVVSRSIDDLVTGFRSLGFKVSTPTPLMAQAPDGRILEMGQESAHIVLRNFYIELSAPAPSCTTNHLLPLLKEFGSGVRIVAMACDNAERAYDQLLPTGLQLSPLQNARRLVPFITGAEARFRWFSTESGARILSAITCWVEQLTPEFVFHPAARSPAWVSDGAMAVLVETGEPEKLASSLHSWSDVSPSKGEAPKIRPVRAKNTTRNQKSVASRQSGCIRSLILRTPDIATYRRFLLQSSLQYIEDDTTIWVQVPHVPSLQIGFTEHEHTQ